MEEYTDIPHQDFSRQQQRYAIVESPFDRGGYFIIEVLRRTPDGMVYIADSVLSEQRTVDEAQKILDRWDEYDRSRLLERFEAWKVKESRA